MRGEDELGVATMMTGRTTLMTQATLTTATASAGTMAGGRRRRETADRRRGGGVPVKTRLGRGRRQHRDAGEGNGDIWQHTSEATGAAGSGAEAAAPLEVGVHDASACLGRNRGEAREEGTVASPRVAAARFGAAQVDGEVWLELARQGGKRRRHGEDGGKGSAAGWRQKGRKGRGGAIL